MDKQERSLWTIRGGIAGAIALSVLGAVMLAFLRSFFPQSVHMSWNEFPITLILTVPSGFMLGALLGNDLSKKTKSERIEYLKEASFCLFVVAICHLVQNSLWNEPKAKDNFLLALAWDGVPLLLAFGLWKLVKRHKITASNRTIDTS